MKNKTPFFVFLILGSLSLSLNSVFAKSISDYLKDATKSIAGTATNTLPITIKNNNTVPLTIYVVEDSDDALQKIVSGDSIKIISPGKNDTIYLDKKPLQGKGITNFQIIGRTSTFAKPGRCSDLKITKSYYNLDFENLSYGTSCSIK